MSRINTNVQSMIAQRVLGQQNKSLSTSLERLSTGLRVNSAKDDPAGLIASENLRAEKAGTTQAISNAERAGSMIGTAEGSLNEVSSLLTQLQTLVTQTASDGGLSDSEIAANQQQVDSILSSINRIAAGTQFGGKKLLDGTLDYTTSGVTSADLKAVTVNSAKLADGATKTVQVRVTTGATVGAVSYNSAAGGLTGPTTIQVSGNKGTEILALASGATIADIKAAVNAVTESTGVVASTASSALTFKSEGWGSNAFVSVEQISGTLVDASDYGSDAVVLVNGQNAEVDGLSISLRTAALDVDVTMASAFADGAGTSTFYVTGGGADFMIGGEVSMTNRASLGLGSVATGSLGNSTDGFLASLGSGQANSLAGGNAIDAQTIVSNAIGQVSNLRGRLGSFQKYTLDPTISSLQVALENTSSAESAVRDADFAVETANMTRSQILASAASTVLATANSMPQSVLSLLRG